MGYQGKTTIEITNTKTGEKKVVEHKNRVTKAVAEIFKPLGLYTDSNMYSKQETGDSAAQVCYGGLLLLDTVVGSSEDIYFIPAGTGVTGCAVCGSSNTGGNTTRGSYNSVESELDPANGTMKFIYDFTTNQGNGTIASVCLTHRTGGYLSSESTESSNGAVQYSTWECFDGYLSGTIMSCFTAADLAYGLELDEENDEFTFAKPSSTGDTIKLDFISYPAYLRSFDLFWQRGSTKPPEKSRVSHALQNTLLKSSNGTAYFTGWNFRPEDRKLYITNTGSTSIAADGSFQVIAIDVDTKQETLYSLTNKTGYALLGQNSWAGYNRNGTLTQDIRHSSMLYGFVYDGHVYMRTNGTVSGAYKYFKISLTDSEDVTEINMNGYDEFPYVHDAYSGRIYCYAGNGYGGGKYGLVLDTVKNRVMKNEVYTSRCDWFKRFDVKGRHVIQLHSLDSSSHDAGLALSIRNNYLATVNDLSTPITKTSEDTMKITYTLSRADDNETT